MEMNWPIFSIDLNEFRQTEISYLSGAEGAICKPQLYNLRELGELHLIQDDKRSVHTRHSLVSCTEIEIALFYL